MGPHVTESLSAYMDDELAAAEREAVSAHVRGCPSCARHLEELRAVDAAAREMPLHVPDGYFEAFRGSLRKRLEGSRPAASRPLVPAWALAAAAALVLAVLTPRLLRDARAPGATATPPVPASTLAAPPPAEPPLAEGQKDARPADADALALRREPPAPAQSAGTRLQKQRALEQPAAPPAARPAVPPPPPAANAAAAPPARGADAPAAAKEEADALRALGYTGAPAQEDGFARKPQAATAEAEAGPGGKADEAKARRDKAAVGALQDRADYAPSGEDRFGLLARRTVASAAEARSLRDAWRAVARDEAAGPRADEARVRAIEAGAEAWRRGRDEKDRAETRKEGRAYLDRPDALQADRVRAALESLER
jgi:hypothetical protein